MRNFLVKHLFGRYWWKLPFQKQYNTTDRGPVWFYSGYIALILFIGIFGFGYLLAIPWTLVVAYFGFPIGGLGYFQKFPIKWSELDDEQKWFYGQGVMSGDLNGKNSLPFDDQMMTQWRRINLEMKAKYNL